MKKKIILFSLIFISTILMQGSLPDMGLLGLLNGVNIKNNITLVSSDFLFNSLLIFYNFGNAERYVNGYGKYQLLRCKKRELLLRKVMKDSFITICEFYFLRIVVYMCWLFICKEKIYDFRIENLVIFFTLGVLSVFFISSIQIAIELKYSSVAGLISAFAYYVISTMLGGFFLEYNIFVPIIFLTTNFTMKYRTDRISANYIGIYGLYLFVLLYIFIAILFSRKIIKQKDIF